MAPFSHHSQTRLPHSTAFATSSRTRRDSNQDCHFEPTDLDSYTQTMRRWTLCQLRASISLPTPQPTSTTTPTIISPLYPTNSSLYGCNISTPTPNAAPASPFYASSTGSLTPRPTVALMEDEEAGESLGDVGTTPCNTPSRRHLRRRCTVAAERAAGKKARDEVEGVGEGQARLRPVVLWRSLSCAG